MGRVKMRYLEILPDFDVVVTEGIRDSQTQVWYNYRLMSHHYSTDNAVKTEAFSWFSIDIHK